MSKFGHPFFLYPELVYLEHGKELKKFTPNT